LQHHNHRISSVKDIANTIASTLSHISSNANYSPNFQKIKAIAEKKTINFKTKTHLSYNSNFTYLELNRALQTTHNTSSGPDNIAYGMLKKLSHSSLLNLLVLFNRIWQEHTFPTHWRSAIVIPILKPGKEPTNPLSYRPIALTNCICKVLEKMVNSRLVYYLEKNNSLSNNQSGFRRGRCTLDNIVDLETRIRNSFVKRNHSVAVFFDIEKAYDKTWRHGILQRIYDIDMRGNLPIFIQNFLALRNYKVRIGNTLSDEFIQEQGVPQGSVLSVTLFILAIDNVLKQMPFSVSGSLYVDDLHIFCGGNNMRFIERQLQKAINNIQKWSEENGFNFSSTKTQGVHFCRKRGLHPDPDLHFGSENITFVNEIKFLGIIFDKKLTFLPHTLYLRKKCEKALNALKVLSNTSWGADRLSMLKIYNSLICSKLDYGCVVYGSARNSVLKKLDTIHHAALRLCSGAFRTSPIESLYVDCHQISLNLRRQILSIHYFFRISSLVNHPNHNRSCCSFLARLYQSRPTCIEPFHERTKQILHQLNSSETVILASDYKYPPWHIPEFKFLNPFFSLDKASTADTVYYQFFSYHRQCYYNYTPIFTDGSKTSNAVGCAFVVDGNSYSYKLQEAFSIFSAELLAIFKALEYIEERMSGNFIIYTDSLSSLKSLSSADRHSHPLTFKILTLLDKLSLKGFSVLFCWVPSHVGIRGNELADKAAKSALTNLLFPLPLWDAKKRIKQLIHSKWQQSWDMATSNKLHTIKQNIEYWPPLHSRKEDVILTRLRIGHTRFTHRHLLLSEPPPLCQQCNTMMSVKHILTECTNFIYHRHHYFHSHTISLIDILSSKPHENIFKFLKHIGFYPHI
jgi:ribonuclease HI